MQYVKNFEIGGKKYDYIHKKKRGQRSISLSVLRGGLITLVTPYAFSDVKAEKFVEEKKEWLGAILKKIPITILTVEERNKQYLLHKANALSLVTTLLQDLEKQHGFTYQRVSIRSTSSRWGSCSAKKVLSFDYRIVFLPPHVQKYLVVHEYCHLQEMNHSRQFWSLVEKHIPQYKEVRKELKNFSV